MFRFIVSLMLCISLIACTSMRPQPVDDRGVIDKSLKVGDEVAVKAINGKDYLLKLIEVDDQKIVGIGDNKKVTIRYEQIVSMQVRKVSAGKTAAVVGGTVIGLYVLLGLAALYAFSQFGKTLGGD